MSGSVAEVLTNNLQVEAALDQWDQPPSIDFVLRQDDGEVTLEDMEVPLAIWAAAPHHQVITSITAVASQLGFPQAMGPSSGTLIGVAIHTEAWAFLSDKDFTEEEKAHFNELADLMERQSIAGHPEAVESKMIMALIDNGDSHMVSLRRDTGAIMNYDTTGDGEGFVDGRMLHALGHLLDAFKVNFS